MQGRLRRAMASLKEHAYVSYAKAASAGGFCDLQLLLIKATSPDDTPTPEKYIHNFLNIFAVSPTSFRAFALVFAKRFGSTRCWRVAVKCLILLHRLLRSTPEEFRTEVAWARSNRFLTLYPSDFVDRTSTSSPGAYTLFVRAYARLLDECCSEDVYIVGGENEEEEDCFYDEILLNKANNLRRSLYQLPLLQSLLDRAMECRPPETSTIAGVSARSTLVRSALRLVIRDSVDWYGAYRKQVVGVMENMIEMAYRNCVAAFSIYKKAAVQAEELCEFYVWCQEMRLCGEIECPLVEIIPHIQIRALESFLNGMWGLNGSPSTLASTATDGEGEDRKGKCEGEEMRPLIDLEMPSLFWINDETPKVNLAHVDILQAHRESSLDEEGLGWEELLDASISMSCIASSNQGDKLPDEQKSVEWQMQVYNPCGSVL